MLFAIIGMRYFGISANLMSLGAIDFGLIVDAAVILVENCVRHIAHGDNRRRPLIDVIRDAALEVRKPTMFGELIIMIVYLPILTLEGIEGKMFRPMALTVIFALIGSMIMSLTLMPVLASLFLPRPGWNLADTSWIPAFAVLTGLSLVLEFIAEDNLDGAQRAGCAIAREPDFAVAAATDALDQVVIGNEQGVGKPH